MLNSSDAITTAAVAVDNQAKAAARARGKYSLVSCIGGGFLILVTICAILAPWLAPYNPTEPDILANLAPPSFQPLDGMSEVHLLGTDILGRDILSGVIYGSRVSIIVAFAAVLGAGLLGTVVGLIAGYARGWLDEIVMRLVDVQLAFPFILLAIMIMYVLGPGLWNVVIVL